MGANVFANGKEISGKGSGNKTIAAMPDVCLSPPSPPAGPIPIPYPNFSQASDTTDGSKKVKIGGKEVCLKGKSSFKKSKGDEAATRNFGASVVSHKIQGAVKHQAGSFDVKFEGSNVVRFGDITTGNHSNPGLPPGPDVGKPAPGAVEEPDCEALQREVEAMRRASDAANRAEGPELRQASDAARRDRSYRSWQQRVENRINQRAQGALTASQTSGGPVRRWASNTLNREALQQRGLQVEAQGPLGTNSNVCGGGEPYDPQPNRAHPKTHTEAQALEAINWSNPPDSISFATDWPARTNGQIDPDRQNYPCEGCQDKMREACECGLQIYVCVEGEAEDFCAENT